MSLLAKINQKESLEKIFKKRPSLYEEIIRVLKQGGAMTSREIAQKIGRYTRQDVQPRLTELKQKGVIEEYGKKYDEVTDRNVMSYVIVREGFMV